MIEVSQDIRDYIQKDSRSFFSRLICEGEEVEGTIKSMAIQKGSCGGSSLQPQSLFSSYVNVSVDNCPIDLTGRKVEVQIGVKLDGEDDVQWSTIATVYVSKPSKKGKKITFQGLGTISAKLGKKCLGEHSYTSVSSLLARLEEVAGCKIILDEGFDDEVIPEVDLSDYYYREVLGMIAGLYFGYATETASGDIVIKSFKSGESAITAYPDRMKSDPDFYDVATVEGIQVIAASDTELITGELQNCSLTSPFMTKEIFDKYNSNFTSFEYQPYEMELTLGDFTIEPWDLIHIEDREGVSHTLRCMSIKHVYDGGLKTTVSAPTLDTGEDYSRPETEKKSTTTYNAFVAGNFGSGSSGGTGTGGTGAINTGVHVFEVVGANVENGVGWIDSGGGQAFMTLDMSIPSVMSSSGSFTEELSLLTSRDLTPYKNSTTYLRDYITVPVFTYNGSSYFGAGGLTITAVLTPINMECAISFGYSNEYLFTELGNLSVYSSETGTYQSLVQASFQLHFSWLLNTVA
jgi:hypothetical protein